MLINQTYGGVRVTISSRLASVDTAGGDSTYLVVYLLTYGSRERVGSSGRCHPRYFNETRGIEVGIVGGVTANYVFVPFTANMSPTDWSTGEISSIDRLSTLGVARGSSDLVERPLRGW